VSVCGLSHGERSFRQASPTLEVSEGATGSFLRTRDRKPFGPLPDQAHQLHRPASRSSPSSTTRLRAYRDTRRLTLSHAWQPPDDLLRASYWRSRLRTPYLRLCIRHGSPPSNGRTRRPRRQPVLGGVGGCFRFDQRVGPSGGWRLSRHQSGRSVWRKSTRASLPVSVTQLGSRRMLRGGCHQ
jgi:hypothetical protein